MRPRRPFVAHVYLREHAAALVARPARIGADGEGLGADAERHRTVPFAAGPFVLRIDKVGEVSQRACHAASQAPGGSLYHPRK